MVGGAVEKARGGGGDRGRDEYPSLFGGSRVSDQGGEEEPGKPPQRVSKAKAKAEEYLYEGEEEEEEWEGEDGDRWGEDSSPFKGVSGVSAQKGAQVWIGGGVEGGKDGRYTDGRYTSLPHNFLSKVALWVVRLFLYLVYLYSW